MEPIISNSYGITINIQIGKDIERKGVWNSSYHGNQKKVTTNENIYYYFIKNHLNFVYYIYIYLFKKLKCF